MINKSKVILTGSNGFIGKNLEKNLSSIFEVIKISYNELNSIFKEKRFKEKFIERYSNKNIICFIHLAAYVHKRNIFTSKNLKSHIYFSNVDLTKTAAEISLSLNIPKFIFSSTVGIYGFGTLDPDYKFNTFSPLMPQNLYSASKLSAEYMLQSVFSEYPDRLTILRVASVINRDAPGSLSFIRFFVKYSIPFPIIYVGNNNLAIRSFVSLKYLISLIKEIIRKDIFSAEIVNVSSEDHNILSLLRIFSHKKNRIFYFSFRINIFFAKLILRIPIIKNFFAPLLLNLKL